MDDEPIRFLTHEQFEAHRASIVASRAREQAKHCAPQSELTKPQSTPPQTSVELFAQSSEQESAEERAHPNREVIDPPSAQALELGAEIWELRKKGFSAYEVHRRLAIPLASVEQILEQFEGQLYPDVGAAVAQRLVIDDGRLEDLFKTYLPLATSGSIKAAGIVLGAIKGRVQLALAMAGRPESAGGKDGSSQINVITWLSQVMPSVQQVVNQVNGAAPISRGKQNLVLECEAEAEIDGSPTNGGLFSGGSSR
jgi:hypothetical protein